MKISITFNSPYREMYCTYCEECIHVASEYLPAWVSEQIGKLRFWWHKGRETHRVNRPTGELAPAPQIDPEAFERAFERHR